VLSAVRSVKCAAFGLLKRDAVICGEACYCNPGRYGHWIRCYACLHVYILLYHFGRGNVASTTRCIYSCPLLSNLRRPPLNPSGAGFTKRDFDYGLDIVDSQTSDRHLNQSVAQSIEDSDCLMCVLEEYNSYKGILLGTFSRECSNNKKCLIWTKMSY